MSSARGLTVAVWIFCINATFTIFNQLDIFGAGLDYTLGDEMLDVTATAPELTFLGVAEIVNALNVFIDLILGPFTLMPQLLGMIGISGVLNSTLCAAVWLIYGWFVFQLITGRSLRDVA